jgi:hypothetical protein
MQPKPTSAPSSGDTYSIGMFGISFESSDHVHSYDNIYLEIETFWVFVERTKSTKRGYFLVEHPIVLRAQNSYVLFESFGSPWRRQMRWAGCSRSTVTDSTQVRHNIPGKADTAARYYTVRNTLTYIRGLVVLPEWLEGVLGCVD